MKPTRPPFPLLPCTKHRFDPQPGYIICRHVIEGEPAALHKPPTAAALGELVCGRAGHALGEIELWCKCCVEAAGYLQRRGPELVQ